MSDIATVWNAASGTGDWTISPATQAIWTDEKGNSIIDQAGRPVSSTFTAGRGVAAGDDLLTAVLISLFTDAEAGDDDTIPAPSSDPRGWWAGPIGSKLWLRARMKATPLVAVLVKGDIEQALAWMVADDVVAAVDVTTEWLRPNALGALVVLRRQDGAKRALAFSRLWENS